MAAEALGGSSLGTLFVRLTADSTNLVKGVKQAETTMAGSSVVMLKQAGLLSAALVGAFAAIGAAAVHEFAKFEKAMVESTAIMGDLTEETKKQMREAARAIARESHRSHEELARSYYYLASAGLDAQRSMAALPAVAKFASAGNFEMAKATELLSDAQAALGLKVKDTTQYMVNLTRVSDVLVKSSVLSNATTQQFAEALTNKASAALRNANKDIEEGVAVLAAFADQGVKGTEAGERFAIVMRDLQRTAVESKQVFKDFGVAVYDSQGNMRNLADILEDLEKALAGASVEEKRMAFQMMGFQDRSLGAILSLMGTSQAVRDYEKVLRAAGNTTEEVAKRQKESLAKQLDITTNLLKDMMITIGEGLAPIIKDLNASLQDMLKTGSAYNESIKETATILGTSLVYSLKAVMFIFGGLRDLLKLLLIGFLKLIEITLKAQLTFLHLVEFIANKFIQGILSAFNFMIRQVNKVVDLLPEAIKSRLGLAPMKEIATSFTLPFIQTLQEQWEKGIQLVQFTADDLWEGLVKTSVGATKEVEKTNKAVATSFKETAKTVEQSAKQIGGAVSRIRKEIDSARVTELLQLLGTPEGTRRRGKLPGAKELLGGITPAEGGVMDASKAARMLQEAGMDTANAGAAIPMYDAFSEQSSAIAKEIQANQDKLKILEDLGKQEIELTEQVQAKKAAAIEAYNERIRKLQGAQNMVLIQAGQEMFGALTEAAKNAAGEQSGIYRVMFAASKAFAIAESLVKIQQGIASALSLPFPANLVAAASVVTAAANIISTISSVQLEFGGGKAEGGAVSSGKAYLVGERGPEMFAPSSRGSIIPNDQLGTGGTKVIINNYTDAQPQVTETQDGNQRVVEIVLRRIRTEISSEIRDGRGDIHRSMEQTWGLRRGKA